MTGFYAASGRVSTDPIEGGIAISAAEYQAAIDAALEGKQIDVENGAVVLRDPPCWAAPGMVSKAPIPGGIEITFEQYEAAVAAIAEGKLIVVEDSEMTLVDPPPPPMPEITRRQLRMMLVLLDMDPQLIVDAINTIEDDQTRRLALVEWQEAATFDRQHPLVDEMAALLEFEPAELDALWAYAAAL